MKYRVGRFAGAAPCREWLISGQDGSRRGRSANKAGSIGRGGRATMKVRE